jgi:monovalent cation:H+ antiporter, CPA1 family
MSVVVFGLIMLIMLLAAAALAVPLARWLGLPVTILLAALGLSYGIVSHITGDEASGAMLGTYDAWFVDQVALDSHSLLYLLLPPLLFEMALAVNVRRLLQDVTLVMVMAIFAVATATAAVGFSFWAATTVGLTASLILGAAVATTDPGAVISTFRGIGAPRRLLVVLEGESLLNDAAAIAIFGLLIGILRHEVQPSLTTLALSFLYSFGAGAAVGAAIALIGSQVYRYLVRSTAAEASMTVAIAYGSYIAAEQLLGGSGVVSVVFAGLLTGSTGFLRMGPGNWQTVLGVWGQIGFWSNALILMLATSLVPGLIAELGWMVAPLTALVYITAAAARGWILYGVVPLMARLGLTAPLSPRQSLVVLWGGVRGPVTLLLAVSIAEIPMEGNTEHLLAGLAASYTLTTIFLNASTLGWLTRRLGLNRLSASDLALRETIVAGSLERVRSVVRNMVRDRDLEPEALRTVEAALGQQRRRVEALAEEQARAQRIPFGERLRLGLTIVNGQEMRLIRRAFEEGAIGPRAVAVLRLDADRMADAIRAQGREGYQAAFTRALQPSLRYRVAIVLQRRLHFDWSLRAAIEIHFGKLLESERIVRELKRFISTTVEPMIGEDAAQNLSELLSNRHEAINDEIDAVAAQYPTYAALVEQSLVARAAIRRERQQYTRLLNDGVIEQELHDSLIADLNRRERAVALPPRLDLTLTPRSLLERVPLFAELNDKQRRMVARAMRTRFTTPGETVLATGDRGTEMFFVASGAFEVTEGNRSERLGTGDFFGGIALIRPLRRRRSTVISLGYCRLLVLRRRDFRRLAKRDPSLESLIRAAAERRLAIGLEGTTASPAEVPALP